MKIDELIRKIRADVNAQISIRNDLSAQLETLRGAEDVDEAKVKDVREQKVRVDATLSDLRARLVEAEAERSEDEDVARLQERSNPTATGEDQQERGRAGSGIEVSEKRTYSPESDPDGQGFLLDVARAARGVHGAQSRLDQHMKEERTERGNGALLEARADTADTPALVIPQYLTDMYQPKGRAGRPLANQMRKHRLPAKGMVVMIPRVTAGTTVSEQVNELDDVDESQIEDELIPIRVRTAAGAGTISRQAVDRGEGVDDLTLADLFKAHDTNLDRTLITAPVPGGATAGGGLLAVANTVTYTDADPTAVELYRKILAASANIEDVLQDLDEDDVFTAMRGRRWKWLSGELTDKWPFINHRGFHPLTGGENLGEGYAAGIRGYLPDGGGVITDNNLPSDLGTGTDEDVIAVVSRPEAHLWEDPNAPMYIRAETGPSMKKLGIDLVVFSYFAFCFDRVVDEQGTPKAVHQKITGTGLVPPVF